MSPRIFRSQRLIAFLPDPIPGFADARVFGEYAFFANGANMDALAVALKQEPVPRVDAEYAANLSGNGDSSATCYFGELLHLENERV
ncbi:MAG: hypothetical protein WB566_14740 [Terriglobales bacterium]